MILLIKIKIIIKQVIMLRYNLAYIYYAIYKINNSDVCFVANTKCVLLSRL